MSTGDQTEYLRSKMAERNRRGHRKEAKFSVDGYDRWASSERPARVGGAEKIPAETQIMSSRIVGGACGGRGDNMRGGISAQDFVGLVPQLFEFFNKAKEFTALVKEDLRNPDIMPEKYKKQGEMIASTLEKIGLGKEPHEAMYESCMQHMAPKGKHGGAKDWSAWFKDMGDKLKKAYDWFLQYKPAIHSILKMKSLNPPGFDYASKLEGLMTSVGLGKQRRLRIGRGDGEIMMTPLRYEETAPTEEPEYRKSGVMSKSKGPPPRKQVVEYSEPEVRGGAGCGCGGAKPKRTVNSARGAIVKKVMQSRGVSLGEASRIVKAEGLY